MAAEFLSEAVGTLLPHDRENILSINSDQPVSSAFEKMIEHKILSLPIYDMNKRRFTSFIDMLDIVSFCVSEFTGKDISDHEVVKSIDTTKFMTTPCSKIADTSKRDPYKPLDERATVLKAMETIVHWDVHRLPIVDHEGELITVFTQSHLIQAVFRHMSKLNGIGSKTVSELNMKHDGVISVSSNDMAICAFKAMHDKKVSAVAVVDPSGILIGNISASDWKLVGYDGNGTALLSKPAGTFLSLINTKNSTSSDGQNLVAVAREQPHRAAAVADLNTFSEVVQVMAECHLHRVYVVDSQQKPIGVISLVEVIKTVLKFLSIGSSSSPAKQSS